MLILEKQCQHIDCNTGFLVRCTQDATASLNMTYQPPNKVIKVAIHLDMCEQHADEYYFDTILDEGDFSHLEIEYEHGFKVTHDTDKHVFITASWETKPVPVQVAA
jgi:hypothetical protein